MTAYQRQFGARRRLPRRFFLILCTLAVALIIGTAWIHHNYNTNLRPVSSDTTIHYVTISSGESVNQIAKQLLDAKLIRSAQAFEWYVSSHNERDKLQAGTYGFSQSQTTQAIAEAIVAGKVATDLVTILPGQRLAQVREAFIKAGFTPADVDAALQAKNYRGTYPALADNPSTASVEGFLYPDSYQITATTDPSTIIGESLKEMQAHLTSDVRNGFASQGLDVYKGVTLASIVEQEVPGQSDRNQVAQVFLSRLRLGMRLGSDVTAIYAEDVTNSAYDTTANSGLPPGPISTISASSLQAVAHPATTSWLYFVSGDDGTTYFAQTYAQHQANVAKYCHQKCSQST
jgi:UPF0755 protein